MTEKPRHRLALAALLAAAGASPRAAADLRDELEALAAKSGFRVEGADWIDPGEAADSRGGSPVERLRNLLKDYNYLLVQGGASGIEKVRITSRKDTGLRGSASEATVATSRSGAHHRVEAAVAGPNAVARNLTLLVDTGASTLVLPASLIPELGFDPAGLRATTAQTASGRVPARIGTLASVRVGAVAAHDVEVSFIADDKLQGTMLLGMSFLQRFRVTIDDASNELILLQK
jgi:aspartyl protease family protein